ncbi:MAG: hypothetical protein U5O39_18295 [Gammaproteobacteria bacterium]|nr:hypothetical protein [Gammaproteobacteria bacterium]
MQDVELVRGFIVVREAKGLKSRQTLLPKKLVERLEQQLDFVKARRAKGLVDGFGSVYLPYALERKYPKGRDSEEGGMPYVVGLHQKGHAEPRRFMMRAVARRIGNGCCPAEPERVVDGA